MAAKEKAAKEKPLEKMTAKELRELAMEIPEISGVHGLNKEELISEIKKARGIPEDTGKQTSASVREIKKKIKELKTRREEFVNANDTRMAAIYRKRILKLKKKTRRAA